VIDDLAEVIGILDERARRPPAPVICSGNVEREIRADGGEFLDG
jgi:hypothetical protein